jgi:hypothetical protein
MGAQVEEVVAASQTLARMAGGLQSVVGSFKLDRINGAIGVADPPLNDEDDSESGDGA